MEKLNLIDQLTMSLYGTFAVLNFIEQINLIAEEQRYTKCGKWFEYIENKYGERKQ